MPRPGRPASDSPAAVLRAALSGPYPALQKAATQIVQRALKKHASTGARAEALRLPLSTYHALRTDFPSVFEAPEGGDTRGQKA